jgi:hypothetical protein
MPIVTESSLDRRARALLRVQLQGAWNEEGHLITALESYLTALRLACEHGMSENLPTKQADAIFLRNAALLVERLTPQLRTAAAGAIRQAREEEEAAELRIRRVQG